MHSINNGYGESKVRLIEQERLQSYVAKNMLYLPVSVFTETEVSDRKHLYQVSIRYRCHTVNKDV